METTHSAMDEESLIRKALAQFLQQDVYTSQLDRTLDYKVSPTLRQELNEMKEVLANFSKDNDFKQELTNIQLLATRYRLFITKTLNEFLHTNEDINRLSSEQLMFMHEITILGGKLQSYNQLIATAANHQNIYLKLREAAILNEIDNRDALEYLRKSKDGNSTNSTMRSDINELGKTNKTFDSLVGVEDITMQLRSVLKNISIGLVETFQFIFFYGIPGTGKTALAECIATEFSNGEYYKFDQSFMASAYVGATEARIRTIFDKIRSTPSKNFTIIIDEADNVLAEVPTRQYLNSIKILLQTEISSYNSFGTNLIIVCITNYISRIDQTFKRRATSILPVNPPSSEHRILFLESQLTPQKLAINGNIVKIEFTANYRQALLNSFDSNFVYTNSDMGRLAKNVQDNFLVKHAQELGNNNYSIIIRIFQNEQLIMFYSSTDTTSVPETRLVPSFTIGPLKYVDAMNSLYNYLSLNRIKLSSFHKYFAPDAGIISRAIKHSSTLTKEQSKVYLEQ